MGGRRNNAFGGRGGKFRKFQGDGRRNGNRRNRGRGRGKRGRGRGRGRGKGRRFNNNRKTTTVEDLDKDLQNYLYKGDDGQKRKEEDLDADLDSYWTNPVESKVNDDKQEKNDQEAATEDVVDLLCTSNDKKESDDIVENVNDANGKEIVDEAGDDKTETTTE